MRQQLFSQRLEGYADALLGRTARRRDHQLRMTPALPVAVSIGEPSGIGPELAAKAWQRLGTRLPFFVIGDPDHLSGLGVTPIPIARPAEAAHAALRGLPVLPQAFAAPATPGQPAPENAAGVIAAIARGVGPRDPRRGGGADHPAHSQEGADRRRGLPLSGAYEYSRPISPASSAW